MLELPEAECLREDLATLIKGKTIQDMDVFAPALIADLDARNLKSELLEDGVHDLRRAGKFLIFKLSNHDLVFELSKGTRFAFQEEGEAGDDDAQLVFQFEDGSSLQLFTDDASRLYVLEKNGAKAFTPILKLGPEPFMEKLDFMTFAMELTDYDIAIKTLLLDQSFIAGLGDIYADESLYRAHIHPGRAANHLTRAEAVKLYYAIVETVRLGIAEHGSAKVLNQEPNFVNYMKVYAKDGDYCQDCDEKVEQTEVDGRVSYYCPAFQQLEETLEA